MVFSACALLLQRFVAHGIRTDVCPGLTIWIAPLHRHISRLELSSAGIPPSSTVGAPGSQGAGVAGTQGIGVSTPIAVAVALATVGLARLVHMPKGGMLASGM